jgi:hypothetical protein
MSRVLPLVLTIMLLLMAAPVSSIAQPRRTSLDIQAQIQRSAELQRQALQILTEPERAERLIGNAYAELHAALSTMVINASDQKFPDPLLKLDEQRMRQALGHLQLRHAQDQSVARHCPPTPGGDTRRRIGGVSRRRAQ